jgi:hypothetical protein
MFLTLTLHPVQDASKSAPVNAAPLHSQAKDGFK